MTNKNRLYLDEMGYCVGQVLSVDSNTNFFPQESSCIRIDDKSTEHSSKDFRQKSRDVVSVGMRCSKEAS